MKAPARFAWVALVILLVAFTAGGQEPAASDAEASEAKVVALQQENKQLEWEKQQLNQAFEILSHEKAAYVIVAVVLVSLVWAAIGFAFARRGYLKKGIRVWSYNNQIICRVMGECPYCRQGILREDLREHLAQCNPRLRMRVVTGVAVGK